MMTNDTQPRYPLPGKPASPPQTARLGRGRRGGCIVALLGIVLVLLLPVFLAGLGLVVYLFFPPDSANILILGLDARAGEGYVTRTDSVMVLGVQPASLNASLMSIPRDLYVDTPGYGLQRVNTVNVLGEQDEPGSGGRLAMTAIAQSFQIPIDHYVRVNFDGFIGVVDALGGIEVEIPNLLIDYEYPTDDLGTTMVQFDPGWQHLDGWHALAYARTRHADDDYRRAERQQRVVMAVAQAMLKPQNWPRLPGAITVFSQAVDTDMSLLDLLTLVPPLVLDGATGSMPRLVIDRETIQFSPEGYAIPNYMAISAWLDRYLR